jgi:hypothetical protein
MNTSLKSIASWTLLLLILLQFIPLRRINPPVQEDLQAPDPVKKALKKACYDCHSSETEWSAIGYIAPASWLVMEKVSSGRQVLNFSNWNHKNNQETYRQTRKITSVISARALHQPVYYTLKPEKELTTEETRNVLNWLKNFQDKSKSEIKN